MFALAVLLEYKGMSTFDREKGERMYDVFGSKESAVNTVEKISHAKCKISCRVVRTVLVAACRMPHVMFLSELRYRDEKSRTATPILPWRCFLRDKGAASA